VAYVRFVNLGLGFVLQCGGLPPLSRSQRIRQPVIPLARRRRDRSGPTFSFSPDFAPYPKLSSRPKRPDFFFAPNCGASGRAVEGALFNFGFGINPVHQKKVIREMLKISFGTRDWSNGG